MEEMQSIYMHTPDLIAMTEGPDHRIIFANQSFRHYVGNGQLDGLTVAEAMPETREQGFIGLLDNVFTTGVPFHGKAVRHEFSDSEGGQAATCYGDFIYAARRDEDFNIVGLSICRTIIESHGGRIWLEDSSESGSEFRFSLPRKSE
jgi:hypothetical protein